MKNEGRGQEEEEEEEEGDKRGGNQGRGSGIHKRTSEPCRFGSARRVAMRYGKFLI
jgi:hypothetical protein